MSKHDWFLATPNKVSLTPFDDSAYSFASGKLFEEKTYNVNIEGLVNISFESKPVLIHLLLISFFVATIAPFAGFFVAGLKRALRAEQLGVTMKEGGVIDRLDCVIVTGFFLFIYIKTIVYDQESAFKHI